MVQSLATTLESASEARLAAETVALRRQWHDGAMATPISDAVRAVITSGRPVHLVTLNRDGSPQVSLIWIGLEEDEIVSGHLGIRQKLRNLQRDPRAVLSVETGGRTESGLDQYLTITGRARDTEGGAPELLQRLAHVYLGPDVRFPPMDDPPPGYVIRITPERFGGVGPWAG